MKRKACDDVDGKTKQERVVMNDNEESDKNKGHLYGNFHNYYAFHPTDHRLEKLKDIIEYIGKNDDQKNANDIFEYCDLGCNAGDLTLAIATALQQQLGCATSVHFRGIDMDKVLIQRANDKLTTNTTDKVTGEFSVGNICTDMETFPSVDMTSLLSTTMWIHVHAGDDGLRRVLEQTCQKTKQFLLIEPQPSKCYRKAAKRLRKMGRPEMDVSSDRLKLRPNIEHEIDAILQSSGFRQVSFSSESKTQWNRSLILYERRP